MDQSLRSKEHIRQRDIFDLFPVARTFRKNKLLTLKEATGFVRGYQESNNCTFQDITVVVTHKYMTTGLAEIYTLLLGKGLRRSLIKNCKK